LSYYPVDQMLKEWRDKLGLISKYFRGFLLDSGPSDFGDLKGLGRWDPWRMTLLLWQHLPPIALETKEVSNGIGRQVDH
jgi:hypothetical protein